MNNCPHCILSYLLQHPELFFWLKCPTCGYSKLDEKLVALYPHIDKMSPRDLAKVASNILVSPLNES
jgi:hypothetical protein